jgi:hypothetical protein
VADVRLDRLFGQEESLADLAVHETVGDELEHFDLTRRRILSDLAARRWRERNDRATTARAAPRRGRLESAAVVAVSVKNLPALSSVHVFRIGARAAPL